MQIDKGLTALVITLMQNESAEIEPVVKHGEALSTGRCMILEKRRVEKLESGDAR